MLLNAFDDLKVVVLSGSTVAWKLKEDIESHRPDVRILKGPHPSGKGMMDRSARSHHGLTHEQNKDWLWNVIRAAKRYAEEN